MAQARRTAAVAALLLTAISGPLPAADDTPPDTDKLRHQAGEFLEAKFLPFARQYCHRCHSGDEPESGTRLDELHSPDDLLAQRELWHRAVTHLRAGTMPPEGEPRPPRDEVQALTDALEGYLTSLACAGPRDPGRVTIRRLNRVEYNHTIRDLVGIDYQPADDFPSDDVGYGFDNIGDVLSLSPVLLEKYLAAAEEISRRAIVADDPTRPRRRHYEAEDMQSTSDSKGAVDGVFWLYSLGDVYTHFDAPVNGTYIVRARAFGEQAGDEPARLELRFGLEGGQQFDVPATVDNPEVYEGRFELTAGKHRLAAAFVNDFVEDGDQQDRRDRNLAVDWIEIEGPIGIEPGDLPESHKQIIFQTPEPDTAEGVGRLVLKRFASRAWRRPVSNIEVSRLMRLVHVAMENGDSFERGIQLAMQAVLVSPHFLFRVELPPPDEDEPDDKPRRGRRKDPDHDETELGLVGDWALASRLSYFLWSSMPDDELFKLAEQNTLHEPAVLAAQARRMLADPKSRALVENFAGQWLQLRNLSIVDPDRKRFPEFDDELRAAMRRETEEFFASIVREDSSILDFLNADYTFVNERLARHYGIAGVTGPEFRRVSLAGSPRGGVLMQASVLTVTSNPTRTSPVKRGRWVLEQLLGAPPPPPPPGAPQLADDSGGPLTGTLRQRMEQHRANPDCAVCHQVMDPLGFGLENFDAVGAWRERDGDDPIDPAGELPDGRSFSGPAGLREILVSRAADFRRCLAEKLLTYALGRGLEADDRCVVDELVARVEAGGDRFSALVEGIVTSDPFLWRHYAPERQKSAERKK